MLLVLTAVVLGAVADAGFDREAALKEYLTHGCSNLDVWREMWKGMRQRSPCEIINDAKSGPATFDQAVALVAKEWQAPPEAVSPILEVEFFHSLEDSYRDASASAWATTRYQVAVEKGGGAPAITRALAAGQGWGASMSQLEASLRAGPSRSDVALSLLNGTYEVVGTMAAAIALEEHAETLPAIIGSELAQSREVATRLRLLELALEQPHSPPGLARLLALTVDELLDDGLEGLALQMFEQAPLPVQAEALRFSDSRVDGELLGLELAVAAQGLGREDLSRRLAPTVEAPRWPESQKAHDATVGPMALRELLVRARDPRRRKVDPYPLACAALARSVVAPLAIPMARALVTSQPALARRLLDPWQLQERRDRRGEVPKTVAAFLAPAEAQLHSARDAERARLQAARAELFPTSTADAGAAAHPEPLKVASPWVERPLPPGIDAGTTADEPEASDLHLPPGHRLVRVERQKNDVWVVTESEGLDPVGELPCGGYWLLHSHDGGQKWDAPLYTGLQRLQPYVVVEKSALPLMRGDMVQLEVKIQELDRASVTFPPVGLTSSRRASGLFVATPLARIQADADGDGLTDLVESRLLTDSTLADTDGDGIPDGRDSFPTVRATKPSRDPQTALLQEVVSRLLHSDEPPARKVGTGTDTLAKAIGHPTPLAVDQAVFLEGDPRDYESIVAPVRVIVVRSGDVERISRERGIVYPMSIEVVMDEKGQRAQIVYSEGWRGGSYQATRKAGRWVLVMIESWIT